MLHRSREGRRGTRSEGQLFSVDVGCEWGGWGEWGEQQVSSKHADWRESRRASFDWRCRPPSAFEGHESSRALGLIVSGIGRGALEAKHQAVIAQACTPSYTLPYPIYLVPHTLYPIPYPTLPYTLYPIPYPTLPSIACTLPYTLYPIPYPIYLVPYDCYYHHYDCYE